MATFVFLLSQALAANENGYSVVALVLLVLTVYAQWKKVWSALGVVNVLLAVGGLFSGLIFVYHVWQAYATGQAAEQFALVNRSTGPYWWMAVLQGLPLLLAQGFWWVSLRASRPLTTVVLVLIWAGNLSPFLSVFCRECLPSAWMMLPAPDVVLLGILSYAAVVWGCCAGNERKRHPG